MLNIYNKVIMAAVLWISAYMYTFAIDKRKIQKNILHKLNFKVGNILNVYKISLNN